MRGNHDRNEHYLAHYGSPNGEDGNDAGVGDIFVVPSYDSLFIKIVAQLLCAVALVNVLVENQPDDLSFCFVNHKVADFLILLVHPTKADTLVAVRHGAARVVAFPGLVRVRTEDFRLSPDACEVI